METCWACGKTFTTSQGRKAHQKTCKKYRAHRAEQAALGTARLRQAVPQADATQSTSEVPLILWTPLRHNWPKEVSDESIAPQVLIRV